MKRVLIGGVLHESNTFNPVLTDSACFRRKELFFGEEMLHYRRNSMTETGGFIDVFEQNGIKVVPSVLASAVPGGRVSAGFFEMLCDTIKETLRKNQVDGVAFALHGAMSAERVDDADGEIITMIRDMVGEAVPVVITLDLHANLTGAFEKVDAAVVYRTYPHLDQQTRGKEAARILLDLMNNKFCSVTAVSSVPLMIGPPHNVLPDDSPMSEVFEHARRIEQNTPGILAACPVHGFMQQDVPFGGAGAIVTGIDRDEAERYAEQVSEMLFRYRHAFWNPVPDTAEAVRQARLSDHPPVAIADSGDNIGGGTPGDGTALLHEILKQGVDSALIQICDPESVRIAVEAGIGATVHLAVGGKSDPCYGPPVEITGTVRTVFDGRYRNKNGGGYLAGIENDMGLAARIDSGGITVLLTSYPVSPDNIMHVNAAGVFPEEYLMTVCKGGLAFRDAYKSPAANHHIAADTPGYSTANLSSLPYRNLSRPVFPLDTM